MRYISKKINCTKCGKKKVGSYVKESWCGECVGERRRERNKARRAEKGLPPIGSGRDPKCKKCRTIKEASYVNGSLCRTCKLESEKKRYAKKIAAEGKSPRRKGRNPVCKCGKTKESIKNGFCNACEARRKREYHAKNKDSEVYKLKIAARTTVNRYIRLGRIEKLPCQVCGSNIKTEAHHEDYDKPLDVIWLCRKHHAEIHKA